MGLCLVYIFTIIVVIEFSLPNLLKYKLTFGTTVWYSYNKSKAAKSGLLNIWVMLHFQIKEHETNTYIVGCRGAPQLGGSLLGIPPRVKG